MTIAWWPLASGAKNCHMIQSFSSPDEEAFGELSWEKEKMLMSTTTSVFVSCLNPFPNKPWFLRVCCTRLLKTLWEKEKLLVTSNFSFSRSVFYLFGKFSAIFIKFEIAVCKLFQFGTV